MFEIDKNGFGEFLAQQRKAKGYTQKELADRLYVSDKAVSKWERALSMPDISLLIPLAEILDVSVTELLEGRKLDNASEMDASHVETLVKKALTFSEETPEKKKIRLQKRAFIFGGCTLLALLETLAGIRGGAISGISTASSFVLLLMAVMSFGFGIYFWFLMREKLPAYYDENRISSFGDGAFRMNVPGLYFNNGNWLPIVKCLRLWSVITMVTLPLLAILLSVLVSGIGWIIAIQNIALFLYLGGLFVPIYVAGKKYDTKTGQTPPGNKGRVLATIAILTTILLMTLLLGLALFEITPSHAGIMVGYVSEGGLREWSAYYHKLDGVISKKLYPAANSPDYLIEVNTEQGTFSIELRDSADNIIFFEENIKQGSYPVTLTGATRVQISAEDHKGSFSIAPAE